MYMIYYSIDILQLSPLRKSGHLICQGSIHSLPDSVASTLPATPSEVETAIKNGKLALVAVQPTVSPTPGSKSARPKLDRKTQSKAILDDPKKMPQSTPPTRTAVKAAAKPAKPPSVPPKLERTMTPETSKAVHQCLGRASTADLLSSTGTPSTETPKTTPSPPTRTSTKSVQPAASQSAPPSPETGSEESSDEEDDEEMLEKREEESRVVKAKKEAHARYMRFFRSLRSILPPTLLLMYITCRPVVSPYF